VRGDRAVEADAMSDVRPGLIVCIKEIPGTRLASKRDPIWARIEKVGQYFEPDHPDHPERQLITVRLLQTCGALKAGSHYYLTRRNINIPQEKSIPAWVWAEVAKRMLLGEIQ
jgi:hypothetical protein